MVKKAKISSKNTLKENQLKLKKNVKTKTFDPSKYLSKEFIAFAIMECILNNDPEGIIDLLTIYMEEHNKVAILREANVSRSTAYQAFKHKNPTLKTLTRLVSTMMSR